MKQVQFESGNDLDNSSAQLIRPNPLNPQKQSDALTLEVEMAQQKGQIGVHQASSVLLSGQDLNETDVEIKT